jgi:nitrite reductase (NO-forming)
MHISHGMYGLLLVEPEEGLPAVDHEFYLMQSDFYTEMGGELGYQALENKGHLAYDGKYGNLEEPTFVVFNGRPEALTGERALGVYGEPINTGDTIRLFVGNIGPNLVSSFHVIGEIFDQVYVEGSFSLVNQYVQSTLVPAGGSVGVEMTMEVPGDYLIVDHSIFRIHKGALGAIHVEGPDNPEVYNPVPGN